MQPPRLRKILGPCSSVLLAPKPADDGLEQTMGGRLGFPGLLDISFPGGCTISQLDYDLEVSGNPDRLADSRTLAISGPGSTMPWSALP